MPLNIDYQPPKRFRFDEPLHQPRSLRLSRRTLTYAALAVALTCLVLFAIRRHNASVATEAELCELFAADRATITTIYAASHPDPESFHAGKWYALSAPPDQMDQIKDRLLTRWKSHPFRSASQDASPTLPTGGDCPDWWPFLVEQSKSAQSFTLGNGSPTVNGSSFIVTFDNPNGRILIQVFPYRRTRG